MEENGLVVDEDEEHLGAAVDLLIPAEVEHNGQVDAQERTGNRLYLSL